MEENPGKFKVLNPENDGGGWGGFLEFLEELAAAYPNAVWKHPEEYPADWLYQEF